MNKIVDTRESTSGAYTINGKERKPFWIVYKMTLGMGSAPLIYWTKELAKDAALSLLRYDTSATVYIFKSDGIFNAKVLLVERNGRTR